MSRVAKRGCGRERRRQILDTTEITNSTATEDPHAALIRRWVQSFVVELNLCPFARRELDAGRIRFAVTDARDPEALLEALAAELDRLDGDAGIETTLLIHPHVLADFMDFNDFLDLAEGLIEMTGREGIYQIASFHPDYQFAGTQAGDAENWTNRAPCPVLHLLREASLERAIAAHPDTARIPEDNIALMNRLGSTELQRLLAACAGAMEGQEGS